MEMGKIAIGAIAIMCPMVEVDLVEVEVDLVEVEAPIVVEVDLVEVEAPVPAQKQPVTWFQTDAKLYRKDFPANKIRIVQMRLMVGK